jgi:hypothetical protein
MFHHIHVIFKFRDFGASASNEILFIPRIKFGPQVEHQIARFVTPKSWNSVRDVHVGPQVCMLRQSPT